MRQRVQRSVARIAFTVRTRYYSDNIYEFKTNNMLVRIDKKNWLGNYSSRVQIFQSQSHLDSYLRFMSNHEIESKIIGHEVLQS